MECVDSDSPSQQFSKTIVSVGVGVGVLSVFPIKIPILFSLVLSNLNS